MKKDLISILDLSKDTIQKLIFKAIDLRDELKFEPTLPYLEGKILALVFEKPSLRTRVTFEVAIRQLGGSAIYLGPTDIGLGKRESVADVARNLSRWVNVISARTFSHNTVVELGKFSTVPVINALSDLEHPCQVLADFLTIYDKIGKLQDIKIAWVGDGNNVCHSLMLASALLGVHLKIATPKEYGPNPSILTKTLELAKTSGSKIELFNEPESAVAESEFIYTDTWVSMGQESESEKRQRIFKKFQVNRQLLSYAPDVYWVMHCLPAHRGEEITDDVIDGPHSIVLDQAENRLHIQRAILLYLLGRF
ncbi:MAG: ornithine carbamoyltransferase [candidate division WOR-3 bacterium]|nr:ornithine carbamoyltransferase [candidate division WOR-3 bacterium]